MSGIWTAFLDRDGTINRKPPLGGYVLAPDQLSLLPGADTAIRRLNDAGWRVVVVTNQRGVARGLMSEDDLRQVHERLLALLGRSGATVDRIYHCPHEAGTCGCRKPGIELLKRACEDDPEISFERAVMIGDSKTDVEAGQAVGLRTVSIRASVGADHQVPELGGAVDWAFAAAGSAL